MSTEQIAPISVTVKQAAEITGLSEWSIYSLLNEGRVEGRYQGRRRLVLYRSLRAYVEGLPEDGGR